MREDRRRRLKRDWEMTYRCVETASCGLDVAVAAAPGIGGAVLGEGGLVGGCC